MVGCNDGEALSSGVGDERGGFVGVWVDFGASGYLPEGKGVGSLVSNRHFSGGLFGS